MVLKKKKVSTHPHHLAVALARPRHGFCGCPGPNLFITFLISTSSPPPPSVQGGIPSDRLIAATEWSLICSRGHEVTPSTIVMWGIHSGTHWSELAVCVGRGFPFLNGNESARVLDLSGGF